LIQDYPALAKSESKVEMRLKHHTRFADFIYASTDHVDYIPYWNLLLMQMSAIDLELVDPARMQPGDLRRRYPDKTIIFHAPNHREVKGTGMLVAVCEELKSEGRNDFELVIYEREPNSVILQGIYDSDIVADQFILGSYALFAIEALALNKPVLCYLRPDLYELYSYYSWAKECPILNTQRQRIKEMLVSLLDDPVEREQIGRAGRPFIEKYHSLQAMGEVYDAIIRKVWKGPVLPE
jgi:hypothetical protein